MKVIIIFDVIFLVLGYSTSLKSLNTKRNLVEFNQIELKDEGGKLRENEVVINIKKEDNQSPITIGKNGILYYMTDYNDKETNIFNSSDIEEKTSYQTSFTDETEKDYNITCRLWKPNHKNLRLFCKLDESLSFGMHPIKINNYTLNYGNHKISINFCLDNNLLDQKEYFPFLYSDEQTINIDDKTDSYSLRFNTEIYNKEMLFLGGDFFNKKMLNCKAQKKELICKIKKEDIIEILPNNGGNMHIYYHKTSFVMIDKFPNVLDITVNIKNLQKERIYVRISKLLDKDIKQDNLVPFETNVSDISNLTTEGSPFKIGTNQCNCFLRKDPDKPLLFLCTGFKQGKYSLKELINEEIKLDNINVKYNFSIQPTNNTEEFEVKEGGNFIHLAYPNILDFSKKNQYNINFLFGKDNKNHFNKLRLLPDLEDLKCVPIKQGFTCTIDSEYVDNNLAKYYNLYNSNDLETFKILYEVPPFKVILPKSKTINIKTKTKDIQESIKIGERGILYFTTNYNDTERKIFDASNIEKETRFETMIYSNKISQSVPCRLWKPHNDNLKIICQLINLDTTTDAFLIEPVTFDYNDHTINIFFQNFFLIEKKKYEIPFLYSDRQIIEIKDNIESYNLKFKIEEYNNELLYLYGEVNNYLILDKCKTNEKELNCEISKQKLEEILVKNNEQFRVKALHDEEDLVKLDGVLNITINYDIKEKEDIYIRINGALTDKADEEVPFGFITNITNIPNINSDIRDNCFFKKFDENPLLYLCRLNKTQETFKFGNISSEMVLNGLHYKYNFRIQPFEETYNVEKNISFVNIKLIYPEVLDFTSEDTLTITFIMPKGVSRYLLFNPDSSSLECKDLVETKKCKISASHFVKKEAGYFYLHYSSDEENIKKYYGLSPIKVILPKSFIEIPIEQKDNEKYIYFGNNGFFYFRTNYIDNEKNIFDVSNIEKETTFITSFRNYLPNNYITSYIKCRLWKPKNEKLWLFCNSNDTASIISNSIKMKDAAVHYKSHIIAVTFYYSDKNYFQIKRLNTLVPFLYSDVQSININEEINSYDLKFHIEAYNNQPLRLSLDEKKNIILQDCSENGKELICPIKKEKFYEMCGNRTQNLKLYFCDNSLLNIEYKSIHDININFDSIQKENKVIKTITLLDTNIKNNSFIAYETDITNIPDIISDSFELEFEDDPGKNSFTFNCRMKKSVKTNLLIVCLMTNPGNFYLKEITKKITLDKINAKYNFIIQPMNNGDKFQVNSMHIEQIKFVYPTVLNYYLYDTINIDIVYNISPFFTTEKKIILNPTSSPLTCNHLGYNENIITERCIVPKSHFDGQKEGQYPILYSENSKAISTAYHLSPIQVILPKENDIIIRIEKEDNKDIIKIGQKGTLYLITNFIDKNNTFTDTNIPFDTTIKDENKNKYNVHCKLWKPINETVRIICNLDEKLLNSTHQISLNKTEIIHNDKNIIISQQEPLEVVQFDYEISFLYSEQQKIEINEENKTYNFKFNIENYFDEVLYIHGERDNSIIFDKCDKNGNELNCKLSKEKIEGILIKKNEQFKVSAINDNIGIINFDFILNIIINYEIDEKEDIYVEITGLLSNYSQEGIPIAFETNLTEFPIIHSDIYDSCYFKKYESLDETSLLYLCNFDRNRRQHKIEKLTMNNSHYKYNFIIQPSNIIYNFTINGFGTSKINLVYPELLNFTSEKSLTIRYIISNPSSVTNIKYFPDSDYLECKDLIGLKKCTLPLMHFVEKESNFYHLNQVNYDGTSIHYEGAPTYVVLPQHLIKMYVNDEDNQIEGMVIGKNRFFSFVTDYIDKNNIFDNSDIEETTKFNTTIIQGDNYPNYKVTCRFWKPKNDKIRLICKLSDNIGLNYIKINSATFMYKTFTIAIISKLTIKFPVIKTDKDIPFLYADKQEINIEENKQFYDLKFKIEGYNKDVLFLQRKENKEDKYLTDLVLDNCTVEGKDLTCKIEKDKIIESLYYNGEIFEVDYFFYISLLFKFSCVLDIQINYNIPQKEDVFVGITKLLQNNLYAQNYIAYETNITSISNVNTDFFFYNTSTASYNCRMKKSENKSLLLLCFNKNYEEKSSLGENDTEVVLENIHIKYNFRIQPMNMTEEFTLEREGSSLILLRYPIKLDFNKDDVVQIYFLMFQPLNIRGFRLNPDSEELDCVYPYKMLTICSVPRSHFNESGYYYTYYSNPENELNIFYDITPIFVNLQKDDKSKTDEPAGIIAGSVIGGLALIGIIVFFVVRYFKKKNASSDGFSGKNENAWLSAPIETED